MITISYAAQKSYELIYDLEPVFSMPGGSRIPDSGLVGPLLLPSHLYLPRAGMLLSIMFYVFALMTHKSGDWKKFPLFHSD